MPRLTVALQTVLVAIGLLGFALGAARRVAVPQPSPQVVREALGRRIPDLYTRRFGRPVGDTLRLADRPRVLYFFSTQCHFCTAQRQHVATLLGHLDPAQVFTLSQEPPIVTREYWAGTALASNPPLSVSPTLEIEIGIRGVPAIVFLDERRIIAGAYLGTIFGWDTARIIDELTPYALRHADAFR